MVVVEDFTKLQLGARVPTDGPVVRCPRCGRNGVRRARLDGSVRYVHLQISEAVGDGLQTEPKDSCTTAEKPSPVAP